MTSVPGKWRHALTEGEPFQMTFSLRGKDGSYHPFFALAEPLKNEFGQVVQWFGTNTDVYPLRQAEEELRRAEERLRLATDAGNDGQHHTRLRSPAMSRIGRLKDS